MLGAFTLLILYLILEPFTSLILCLPVFSMKLGFDHLNNCEIVFRFGAKDRRGEKT